jgi:ribonuclease HII
MHSKPDFNYEISLGGLVAGADEAGRGPIVGPVVAAAVILDPDNIPVGINDSKKLSHAKRESLFEIIKNSAISYAIASASAEEIDNINILQASLLAMQRAVSGLHISPTHALIDGNKLPTLLPCPATFLIGGDAKSLSIAAASILAKVTRDRMMTELAGKYAGYGWERNAGYPTAEHLSALTRLGITPHHRRSFRPVREMMEQTHAL